MNDVDLTQLAIDRSDSASSGGRARQRLLTRYVLPAGLLVGFLSLVGWSTREMLFPPKAVTVLPVLAAEAQIHAEGSPLFKAAGWIEPRPTPVRVAALAPGVVSELLVVEDQAVKAGAPVARLVKEDAELTLRRAQADLQLREAEREETEQRPQGVQRTVSVSGHRVRRHSHKRVLWSWDKARIELHDNPGRAPAELAHLHHQLCLSLGIDSELL